MSFFCKLAFIFSPSVKVTSSHRQDFSMPNQKKRVQMKIIVYVKMLAKKDTKVDTNTSAIGLKI